MSRYVLIETKGPLGGGEYAIELGKQLRDQQHEVTVYLLQDGVFTGRRGFPAAERLREQARAAGLRLVADRVALRERGLVDGRLAPEVSIGDMDELVDLLMERSDKAIWH